MHRTHTCGELRAEHAGKTVTLAGWADSIRVQGKIGFVMIRDRYGKTQCFIPKDVVESSKLADIRKESVLKITGEVKTRPEKQIRKELVTGEIELSAISLEVLNPSDPLPLELDDSVESTEETRLKHRFLDLRRTRMQKNLVLRHKLTKTMRDYLDKNNFLDIETPFMAKSTPEGARDYLVPSRVQPGNFYALPQSPQLFKQLLMISGYDRYAQIVRCFRDEDLRADRQPEFTQLDIEMAFVEEKDIYEILDGLMAHIFKEVLGVTIKTPLPRLPYKEVMEKYGTDKPDLRKEWKTDWALFWVVDFPMFDYSKEQDRYLAMHHPFTMPKAEDIPAMEKGELDKVFSYAYDMVLNGSEIGGGSIRCHDVDLQKKIFTALKISEKEAEEKFGFLLSALRLGAPPHGGLAFGLDRLAALMVGEESIREVIAFPKNKDARDLMLDAPSSVSQQQLDDLGLSLKK
ncbi:aspartate--tRNA ligase [Candidatus Woesearchaeota archaeon]|nr:aspartate--tRNA ligase [Candidatus Woesearchaeota archaeon]